MASSIATLFAPEKEIFRKIEKVVTFGSLADADLGRELAEYVVTNNLLIGFDRILGALDAGMRDRSHEVGIWVSGFYGSGKSSFAKYLGLALDSARQAGGVPVFERLANRIGRDDVAQLLRRLVQTYNPQVFLLDLASEQISTHVHAPVEDVIYAHVMKWAGFAAETAIAELEQLLDKDGQIEAFKAAVLALGRGEWDELKFNSPAAAKTIAARLAVQFYPTIWTTSQEFQEVQVHSTENQRERMKRMLDLIRRRSGREHVVFVLDEVGQYVASDQGGLILKLQGTMQNLKDLGQGKAWMLATAQQTLTEDDPRARFNSDQLFKLNDRFPIKLGIEASDIQEIATKRLLGKSGTGATQLRQLYGQAGEQLRAHTRLEKTERTIFKDELREDAFVDLYPFLPTHFTLLNPLLSKLTKGTGGVGLRSVIRIIQDVLVDRGEQALANQPLGTLATAADLFGTLRADIRRSYSHLVEATEKVRQTYGDESAELRVAQAVVLLQIVDDFPLTVPNLAAMLHPNVASPSQQAAVRTTVEELKSNRNLTLKEIDGTLRFMTDAVLRLGEEKDRYQVTDAEARKVMQEQLEEIFSPTPSARLLNEKTVVTGIQLVWRGRSFAVVGASETMQTHCSFELPDLYASRVQEVRDQSAQAANATAIFAVGKLDGAIAADLEEIVRCEMMARGAEYEDKETADYRHGQRQDAEQAKRALRQRLSRALAQGELLVRGAAKPLSAYTGGAAGEVRTALADCLREAADRVYAKLGEAARAVLADAAKQLLSYDDLKQVPETLNPFQLIATDGTIKATAPALRSLTEYLDREKQVEGRKLLDYFAEPPYGWAKDTTRYLVATMFLGSLVNLRIGAVTVKVKGDLSAEKLASATAFGPIGIMAPDGNRPTPQQLTQAANNLTRLTGQSVPPLEQRIAAAVVKAFPELQRQYGALAVQLNSLGLPGGPRAEAMQQSLTEILKGDGSDATFRLGSPDADLVRDLVWAREIGEAFGRQGLEPVVRDLRDVMRQLPTLPAVKRLNTLRTDTDPICQEVEKTLAADDFCRHLPMLRDARQQLNQLVQAAGADLFDEQKTWMGNHLADLPAIYGWTRLTPDQQAALETRLRAEMPTDVGAGVAGIQATLNAKYRFDAERTAVEEEVGTLAEANEDAPSGGTKRRRAVRLSALPRTVERAADLNPLIEELTRLRDSLGDDEVVDLQW